MQDNNYEIYENKLKDFLNSKNLAYEFLAFEETCHTVEDACNRTGAREDDFIKSICMLDNSNNLIVAIVLGNTRASTTRVSQILNLKQLPRVATPPEIEKFTGYLCGGVPAFGYSAIFLIDPKVLEKKEIYTGGGTPRSLVKISTEDILNLNSARIERIRK
ncbi:MAG: YbaK/EbsC family protein [archaeon]